MNKQRSQFEGLLLKSVAMLTLVVFGLYSIKTVLSDCTIFSKVNCQSENRKISALEEEINQIKQQISTAQSNSSSLKCTEIVIDAPTVPTIPTVPTAPTVTPPPAPTAVTPPPAPTVTPTPAPKAPLIACKSSEYL